MELETQRKTLYMTSKVIFILYCDVNVWTPAGNTDVNVWTPEGSVDAPGHQRSPVGNTAFMFLPKGGVLLHTSGH